MTDNNEKNIKLRFSTIAKTDLPNADEIRKKGGDVIQWGQFNDFPQQIYALYEACSMFTSIVGAIKVFTLGDGINFENVRFKDSVNRKGESIDDILTKCIIDRAIFGGFALEIIRNKFHDIAEINWLDMRYIRLNEDEDKIYYNKKWNQSRTKAIEYKRYTKDSKEPVSVFYYKGRNSRGVYPVPEWIGALKSVKIMTEIDNYNLNNIINNFTPSAMINFNNGSNLSEDVMDEIETKVYEKFVGTEVAGRFMLSFNDDKEHATTIERIPDDGLENKYTLLKENTQKNIYSAFRINPCLLGFNQENMGFNTQEFEGAFKLYNKTVIQPMQKEFIDAFEKLFGKGCITISPFTLKFEDKPAENNNIQNVE